MKTMRRISIGVMAFIMAIGMSVSVFAADGSVDSKSEALNIALDNAGITKSQAKDIEVEKEMKHYDVEFTKRSNGTEFDLRQRPGKSLLRLLIQATMWSKKEPASTPIKKKKASTRSNSAPQTISTSMNCRHRTGKS